MRWWRRRIDSGLRERALSTIAQAENSEAAGRARAEATIRRIHAEFPNPDRRCSIPDCCEKFALESLDCPLCGEVLHGGDCHE